MATTTLPQRILLFAVVALLALVMVLTTVAAPAANAQCGIGNEGAKFFQKQKKEPGASEIKNYPPEQCTGHG
jgi:hypothetical protein